MAGMNGNRLVLIPAIRLSTCAMRLSFQLTNAKIRAMAAHREPRTSLRQRFRAYHSSLCFNTGRARFARHWWKKNTDGQRRSNGGNSRRKDVGAFWADVARDSAALLKVSRRVPPSKHGACAEGIANRASRVDPFTSLGVGLQRREGNGRRI